MNGLKTTYGDRVAFSRVDARSRLGKEAYEFYNLRGHPIVAILDSEGRLVAQIWGERPREEIETALRAALSLPS